MTKENADWAGALKLKFRWSTLRYEWGRMYFQTDCCGETIDRIWIWERQKQ